MLPTQCIITPYTCQIPWKIVKDSVHGFRLLSKPMPHVRGNLCNCLCALQFVAYYLSSKRQHLYPNGGTLRFRVPAFLSGATRCELHNYGWWRFGSRHVAWTTRCGQVHVGMNCYSRWCWSSRWIAHLRPVLPPIKLGWKHSLENSTRCTRCRCDQWNETC